MVHPLAGDEKVYAVYILASRPYGTLYIGVTGDLISRLVEHRSSEKPGFTSRHKVFTLVHFENFGEIGAAIRREKPRKNGRANGRST